LVEVLINDKDLDLDPSLKSSGDGIINLWGDTNGGKEYSSVVLAENGEDVVLPNVEAILTGEYLREGPDLILSHDGDNILIKGFFSLEQRRIYTQKGA